MTRSTYPCWSSGCNGMFPNIEHGYPRSFSLILVWFLPNRTNRSVPICTNQEVSYPTSASVNQKQQPRHRHRHKRSFFWSEWSCARQWWHSLRRLRRDDQRMVHTFWNSDSSPIPKRITIFCCVNTALLSFTGNTFQKSVPPSYNWTPVNQRKNWESKSNSLKLFRVSNKQQFPQGGTPWPCH